MCPSGNFYGVFRSLSELRSQQHPHTKTPPHVRSHYTASLSDISSCPTRSVGTVERSTKCRGQHRVNCDTRETVCNSVSGHQHANSHTYRGNVESHYFGTCNNGIQFAANLLRQMISNVVALRCIFARLAFVSITTAALVEQLHFDWPKWNPESSDI
ncbi:hypothetical protein CBL_11227 [Carabus blaptoides fortunei]